MPSQGAEARDGKKEKGERGFFYACTSSTAFSFFRRHGKEGRRKEREGTNSACRRPEFAKRFAVPTP